MPLLARPDATLFILGSLPGDASLAAGQYYAHPRNQFWQLLGHAIGEDLQPLPYEQRLQHLADRRIGLWDVIGSAHRSGSLDQAIRNANRNRIGQLLDDFEHLRAIAFNGTTAALLGRKLLGDLAGLTLIDLPSSSPANTRALADKAAKWATLAQYCAAPQI